ncbi:type II toxin-antitoxin system Phd/YefM family antitoxin [soil metagenome]
MERSISATDANREFSRVVNEVANGETYIVTSHGKPVVRMAPVKKPAVDPAMVTARRAHLAALREKPAMDDRPRFTRDDFYD